MLTRSLRLALLGVAIAGAAALLGCPGGTRCARVDGPASRCIDLVCPTGATPRDGACVCGEGSTVVLGACVGYELADAFCGADARIQPGGACAPRECEAGQALDVESGLCLPTARTLAEMSPGETMESPTDQRARCMFGTLVARGGHPVCLVGELACGRGQVFDRETDGGPLGGQCSAAKPCGAGELADEISGQCVRLVRAGGSDHVVDVGAWARLALGIDGGEGTRSLCAPVRAVLGEGTAATKFAVRLSFPDNDVTQVSGRIVAQQAPTVVLDAAARSLDQLLETLRHLGGMATAGAVSLNVSCAPPSVGLPATENVPQDGGAAELKK
jgi:hypothetical protein